MFLRDHFPASIGVTTGQVIDHLGQRSRQNDVIVYDSNRTPMLFSSDEGGMQLVPSEGVLAVIEVKARLTVSTIDAIVTNMESVKNLDKTAYFIGTSPIEETIHIYGQDFTIAPTMYFAFAFEGDSSIHSIASELTRVQAARPPSRRVDSICVLDTGILLNGTPEGKAEAVPRADTELVGYNTENSLLMFYLFLSRYVFQIKHYPINMLKYIPDTFAY